MGLRSDYVKTPLMEKRREKIKETALQMILSQGISRTTMKELAIASGIGRKTLYRFFQDIEDLAESIMSDFAASPESFTATYRFQGQGAPAKLRHAAHAWLRWCLDHENVMRFYYEYDYHFREPHSDVIHQFWKNKPNIFETILTEGVADGTMRLSADQVRIVGLSIPNTIIATVQRVQLRKEVYLLEYGYSGEDIAVMADLLVDGVCSK